MLKAAPPSLGAAFLFISTQSRQSFISTQSRQSAFVAREPDEELTVKIRSSFVGSARTYGARRVWRDVLGEGFSCGLHKVERLMRTNALRARPRRRGLPRDDGARSPSVAPNLLDRQFAAERPNRLQSGPQAFDYRISQPR